MHKTIYVIFSVSLFGCSNDDHQGLIGFWKSNEKMTLESMRSTPGITKEAKAIFNNNFFGKLIIEYKSDTYRSLYENEKDNPKEFYQYQPYKVIEVTDKYYVTESYSDLLGENEKQKLYRVGECCYAYVTKWNFKEFFCRIK